MEYEQTECGRRIVVDAITRQDVNAYHDLLSPDVLLVTHFPYPTSLSDSNMQAVQQWVQLSQQRPTKSATAGAAATASNSGSKRRARELLQQQEKYRERRQKRYEAFRKRREGHHSPSTEGTEAEGEEAAAATDNATQADGARGGAAKSTSAVGAGAAAHQRDVSAKNNTSKKSSASAHSGGGGSNAARVPLGVRWFRQQQEQLSSPAQGRTAGSAPAQAPTASATQNVTSENPAALSYADAVDIAEGRLLVSFRLFELLHWIRSSKDTTSIAPIEVDVQLRKDILQEDEVLPMPPAPTTVQEKYEQLGMQYTERNQPLSCITVVWGRDYLLLRDKIYLDDGLIVTIQRTMLSVPEVMTRTAPLAAWNLHQPRQQRLADRKTAAGGGSSAPAPGKVQNLAAAQAEQVYKAVESFYGVAASRVNALNTSWPLLDYSFLDAAEPSALLRLAPASGHVHVGKQPRAAADPRLAQGVFLNQSNDPSPTTAQSANARTIIRAKNKRGEEEAYEFSNERNHFAMLQEDARLKEEEADEWGLHTGTAAGPAAAAAGGGRRNAGEGGGAVRGQRYDASCVRVSGCHLRSKMDQLVPVLHRLIANSILTLHTLDLSQNSISTLPDLRALPLQSLRLHDNAIADWRVVESQIAPLPYLTILTLHGNPIAEEKEITASTGTAAGKHSRSRAGANGAANTSGESAYWKRLLALLLGNPARVAPLRQVDFVTLTAQDFNVAGAHALFTTGKSDVLDQARTMNAGTLRQSQGAKAATTKVGGGAV
ncbi:hypothetical protein ABB37_09343 [Leptomonas pyrrhocoris]|uniref:Leucine-rich repeat-containing protein 51 n=1 Tax=Leptomonas pyrrhocoris TaxID=157538 RepID=A0A0M9FR84_LEPPY|nr:hypothetical protein ABB37_09343 [Leptomonas pyrrhocoris]XP_015652806.1 hypothetical protein ABB37_09343 [Leptomonas pyrrhocoris]KPA74366.1 hypothetical protein ABB37_09343 [Leptomonas pyrrhocoris]KPA74367.1 hypothetical protein ABB37_09343 [Leptomonas pyrrhocoris]|eukprot:XP_015652805.1 hypothetical protein ABB37_09343 [Leptomonas pyrrhocoris]